ncbi:PREDICTED: uncharacterized protein LOC108370254 [Rhagoletis zephyria]|uniref:uncharacterized protein LOC108370254 n=1 Tax=Rhagoletis zephyria TaxID=28612 RepID=UPI000811974B|nr:PREDICTED: uncharacterized protein LOC108370254 [Rhagoletis zephyria]XP_036324997.1 uncharacterized protein LOC118738180 [Rhagoletis pomonella]
MKAFLIIFSVLACLFLLVSAAPADQPGVHFLSYSNDQDFEAIQKQIIAQYENLGGSSQFHEVQSASVVHPNTLKINI